MTSRFFSHRVLSAALALVFFCVAVCPAQAVEGVSPGSPLVSFSPNYVPSHLVGLKVYPDEPFRFDFILDKGDMDREGGSLYPLNKRGDTQVDFYEQDAQRLIKYFLVSLALPEEDLWVNLSPVESDRIIPDIFGQTEMGRVLLSLDSYLKNLMSSQFHPDSKQGQVFWDKVYKQAIQLYGTTDISIDTFHKVWIVPDEAQVYESAQGAYVTRSRLKVMLESDYLAAQELTSQQVNRSTQDGASKARGHAPEGVVSPSRLSSELGWDGAANEAVSESQSFTTDIIRSLLIPAIEEDVNSGQAFASLRQIYYSLILAHWYKKKLHQSALSQVYSDQQKVEGLKHGETGAVERIYQGYLKSVREGVFNVIKEEGDPLSDGAQTRRYFSGGIPLFKVDSAMRLTQDKTALEGVSGWDQQILVSGVFRTVEEDLSDDSNSTAVARGVDRDVDSLVNHSYRENLSTGVHADATQSSRIFGKSALNIPLRMENLLASGQKKSILPVVYVDDEGANKRFWVSCERKVKHSYLGELFQIYIYEAPFDPQTPYLAEMRAIRYVELGDAESGEVELIIDSIYFKDLSFRGMTKEILKESLSGVSLLRVNKVENEPTLAILLYLLTGEVSVDSLDHIKYRRNVLSDRGPLSKTSFTHSMLAGLSQLGRAIPDSSSESGNFFVYWDGAKFQIIGVNLDNLLGEDFGGRLGAALTHAKYIEMAYWNPESKDMSVGGHIPNGEVLRAKYPVAEILKVSKMLQDYLSELRSTRTIGFYENGLSQDDGDVFSLLPVLEHGLERQIERLEKMASADATQFFSSTILNNGEAFVMSPIFDRARMYEVVKEWESVGGAQEGFNFNWGGSLEKEDAFLIDMRRDGQLVGLHLAHVGLGMVDMDVGSERMIMWDFIHINQELRDRNLGLNLMNKFLQVALQLADKQGITAPIMVMAADSDAMRFFEREGFAFLREGGNKEGEVWLTMNLELARVKAKDFWIKEVQDGYTLNPLKPEEGEYLQSVLPGFDAEEDSSVGGIDLGTNGLDVVVKNEGGDFNFRFTEEDLKFYQEASGLIPLITNIQNLSAQPVFLD